MSFPDRHSGASQAMHTPPSHEAHSPTPIPPAAEPKLGDPATADPRPGGAPRRDTRQPTPERKVQSGTRPVAFADPLRDGEIPLTFIPRVIQEAIEEGPSEGQRTPEPVGTSMDSSGREEIAVLSPTAEPRDRQNQETQRHTDTEPVDADLPEKLTKQVATNRTPVSDAIPMRFTSDLYPDATADNSDTPPVLANDEDFRGTGQAPHTQRDIFITTDSEPTRNPLGLISQPPDRSLNGSYDTHETTEDVEYPAAEVYSGADANTSEPQSTQIKVFPEAKGPFAKGSPLRTVAQLEEEGTQLPAPDQERVASLEAKHPDHVVVVPGGSIIYRDNGLYADRGLGTAQKSTEPLVLLHLKISPYVAGEGEGEREIDFIKEFERDTDFADFDGVAYPTRISEKDVNEPTIRIGLFERTIVRAADEPKKTLFVTNEDVKEIARDKRQQERKQKNIQRALLASFGPMAMALLEDVQAEVFDQNVHSIERIVTGQDQTTDAGEANGGINKKKTNGIKRAPLVQATAQEILENLGLLAAPGSGEKDKVALVLDPQETDQQILKRYYALTGELTPEELDARRTVVGYRWLASPDARGMKEKLKGLTREADQIHLSFIADNMPLLKRIADKYRNSAHFLLDDLIQIGARGLLKAAFEFDGTVGADFSTLATINITGEISHTIRDLEHAIKMPARLRDREPAIRRARIALERNRKSSETETVEEIAREATTKTIEVSPEDVMEYLEFIKKVHNLALFSTPVEGTDDLTIGDFIEVGGDPFEDGIDEKREVMKIFKNIQRQDRQALFLHTVAGLTQVEVAEQMGYSQMHISRMITRSLARFGLEYRKPPKTPKVEKKEEIMALLDCWNTGKKPDLPHLDQQLAQYFPNEEQRNQILAMYVGSQSQKSTKKVAEDLGISPGALTFTIRKTYDKLAELGVIETASPNK